MEKGLVLSLTGSLADTDAHQTPKDGRKRDKGKEKGWKWTACLDRTFFLFRPPCHFKVMTDQTEHEPKVIAGNREGQKTLRAVCPTQS